jgi:hypothetical protein
MVPEEIVILRVCIHPGAGLLLASIMEWVVFFCGRSWVFYHLAIRSIREPFLSEQYLVSRIDKREEIK